MSLEDILSGWTGPSSTTEQENQERTERMIREAVANHPAFADSPPSVYAKGSYKNNTNVRTDSDVDIAVQCHAAEYWQEQEPGTYPPGTAYSGIWIPSRLRAELHAALRKKFSGQVDASGSTAFRVHSGTARVDADVVPCFDYRYYLMGGTTRTGNMVFKKSGSSLVNYPDQQLANGNAKNLRTGTRYKKAVRVLKRVENAMVSNNVHRAVPSFFVECLVYNCPDPIINRSTWTEVVRGVLVHIWQGLQGLEPTDESSRWLEVNGYKYLFHPGQAWTRGDGRDFAKAAWNYLGYQS